MKLAAKARFARQSPPFLGRLELGSGLTPGTFLVRNLRFGAVPSQFLKITEPTIAPGWNEIHLSPEFSYLAEGDILRLNPVTSEIRVLYRRRARHNFLFFTERCNSRCVMCSQPPRDVDDANLVEDILQMIPWMAPDTPELGITGGEPTLLHEKLIEVIRCTKEHLPSTALHMLSNGRLLAYVRYARQLADIGHPDFMIGIPLYADTAAAHDFVVQVRGAFEQTLFGLMNLARVGIRIELRIVIHQQTFARLPEFAHFVARNLPFVDQVALMGLELMGYARSNLDALWIDPTEYQDQLADAVEILADAGVRALIFNHQLCLLRPELRPYARRSISDWKNIYLPACDTCAVRTECGGFFASALLRYSRHIQPLTAIHS